MTAEVKVKEEVKVVVEPIEPQFITENGVQVQVKDEKKAEALQYVKDIKKFVGSLKSNFVSFDDEIEKIMLAMLTREHLLFKGKPGVAKTSVVKSVIKNIDGANIFVKQMAKDMTPDYLFGAIDFKKLKDDSVIVHNTVGSIVDADFALLDEIFDAPDMLLRSLLEIMNERTFSRNDAFSVCPLHSAYMVSNFRRQTEETEAFLDRILFQKEVLPLATQSQRLKMYKNHIRGVDLLKTSKSIPLYKVKKAADYVLNGVVTLDDTILEYYDKVLTAYQKESGAYVSPRKSNKLLGVMKASALLDGKLEVGIEHIKSVAHGIVVGENENEEILFNGCVEKILKDAMYEQEEFKEIDLLKKEFVTIEQSKGDTEDNTLVLKIRKFSALRDRVRGRNYNIEKYRREASELDGKIQGLCSDYKRKLGL